MPSRSAPTPAAALQLLEEQAALRQEELERYDDAPQLSNDDQTDESESPKMDEFIKEDGDRALMSITNFTLSEFNGVWSQVQEHVSSRYNTGRGSKSPIKAKDLFLCRYVYLNMAQSGISWHISSR